MRNYIKTLLVILFICLVTGCAGESSDEMKDNTYEHITQEEAKNLMSSETDYRILDVRTDEEYAGGYIPGAICIPNETINETVTEILPDKNQLILVYCRSGRRSAEAARKLAALGYTNIKEFGGINTWPYETEQ